MLSVVMSSALTIVLKTIMFLDGPMAWFEAEERNILTQRR